MALKALRYLAAYLIVVFLAPTFGGLAELVCTPIMGALLPKVRDGNPRTPARMRSYALLSGLTAIVAGFAAIWFARAVFGWLRVEPTIAIAWVLGVAYALNDLNQLRASQGEMIIPRFTRTVGDLFGIVLGARHFL
jgi:hypothetical protein